MAGIENTTFINEVDLKYKLYNSIFLTLPHDGVRRTGILIPVLSNECVAGFDKRKTPVEIMDDFFAKHTEYRTVKEKQDFIFRVIQYIERQVVLMDAVEDAAFEKITDTTGKGSFRSFLDQVGREKRWEMLRQTLQDYAVKIVLTAHPTQFYPATVLGIINDLIVAIRMNDVLQIQTLLKQLGKTPFFKKERPTPLDEAITLTWYLENIFYQSGSDLYKKIRLQSGFENGDESPVPFISFGFWPGGDRDGNPFVTVDTTLRVAERLRESLLENYLKDLRELRHRLSFKGIYEKLLFLEGKIEEALKEPDPEKRIHYPGFIAHLREIEEALRKEHDPIFIDLLVDFKQKVRLFGFHFAGIDIRQDSRVIRRTFNAVWKTGDTNENLDANQLFALRGLQQPAEIADPVMRDTLETFRVIHEIQRRNGESACHRYVISNCHAPEDVATVFALARMEFLSDDIPLDIVPLFESIADLESAGKTMEQLYCHPVYRHHLVNRNNRQTIMLGFSDGTKDGGYFAANWNIYKAKENITHLSRNMGIEVVFFDGRGGPPSRGGENTHKFYSSLGSEIENKEIQVTIQGQTISSKFGTRFSAGHYLELLITAGLENQLFRDESKQLRKEDREILDFLAEQSMEAYKQFRLSPEFLPYLEKMSVLRYYNMANIGSRPSRRNQDEKLKFEDLRAIPFVGSWAQMKQNVPGFFGVGTSLKKLEESGRIESCKDLYLRSRFFRALVENSMQSLRKSSFELTRYMEKDPEFSGFWKKIHQEFLLSTEMLLKISGQQELMDSSPYLRDSIALRASIVLPLVTIQQYAMMKIREAEKSGNSNTEEFHDYEKMVIRSIYGNINASRNSA